MIMMKMKMKMKNEQSNNKKYIAEEELKPTVHLVTTGPTNVLSLPVYATA